VKNRWHSRRAVFMIAHTLNPHPFTDLLKLSNLACAKCFGQITVDRRCLSYEVVRYGLALSKEGGTTEKTFARNCVACLPRFSSSSRGPIHQGASKICHGLVRTGDEYNRMRPASIVLPANKRCAGNLDC
jgi:hypothetical protein